VEKTGIEQPLLSDEDRNADPGDRPAPSDTGVDPLMQYGYGIVAYRNTLFTMVLAFIVFTVLAIPSMIFYSRGTAYSIGFTSKSGNEVYSIGNLGYSNV